MLYSKTKIKTYESLTFFPVADVVHRDGQL